MNTCWVGMIRVHDSFQILHWKTIADLVDILQ